MVKRTLNGEQSPVNSLPWEFATRCLRFTVQCAAVVSLSALPCILLMAQQPQTNDVSNTQPLFSANAKYVQGVGPGYWPTKGSGLTLNLSAGTALCGNPPAVTTYAGGTLTLTASQTNYVYLDPSASCAPAFNTTGFSAGQIPLAKVVTSGSAITAITDVRTWFTDPNAQGPNIRADLLAGADAAAKIRACIAALPTAGGVCDGRGLQGTQTWGSNIFSGTSKPTVLLLGAGTYSVSIAQDLSGWSSVTIVGLGNGQTILQQTGTTNDVFYGTHVVGLTLSGIKFATTNVADQASGYAVNIQDASGLPSSNIRILDNWFEGWRSHPVFIGANYPSPAGIDHVWIERNQFLNGQNTTTVDTCDVELIGAGGPDNAQVNFVWVRDNHMTGQNYHGIELLQNVHHAVIEGNVISGKYWHGIVITNEVNTSASQPDNDTLTIANNEVSAGGRVGIYVQSTAKMVQVLGNRVHDMTGAQVVASIEGDYAIWSARGESQVIFANNVSVNAPCEAIKIVPLQSFSPASGGPHLNIIGGQILYPSQNVAACGGQGGGIFITPPMSSGTYGPISITGLEIYGDGTHDARIVFVPGATTISWSSLSVVGSTLVASGIYIDAASATGTVGNLTLDDNIVHSSSNHGILLNTVTRASVQNNIISNWNAAGAGGHCIEVYSYVTKFKVNNNVCDQTGAGGGTEYGIWLPSTGNANGSVTNNTVLGAHSGNFNVANISTVTRYGNSDGINQLSLYDSNGNAYLKSTATASAVDYLNVTNGAAGSPGLVKLTADGTDSNISVLIASKNAGDLTLDTPNGGHIAVGPDSYPLVLNGSVEIGGWPTNSVYAFFGNSAIDQTNPGNYALSQDDAGETYLNSSSGKNLVFRINNATKAILLSSGYFGVGNSNPSSLFSVGASSQFQVDATGNLSTSGHLNQSATGKFAGTCAMASGTTCTISISAAYSGTPVCVAVPQGTTAIAGACSVSGTTVTITAASSNSQTWGAILVGNPN